MPFDPNQILGPFGALVLSVVANIVLWRELNSPTGRTRRAEDLAQSAVDGLRAALETDKTLVEAFEKRNEIDAERVKLDHAAWRARSRN